MGWEEVNVHACSPLIPPAYYKLYALLDNISYLFEFKFDDTLRLAQLNTP